MKKMFFAASFLALMVEPGIAGFTSGNDLLHMCQMPSPLACIRYIEGISDMQDALLIAKTDRRFHDTIACIPDGVSELQLRDVVLQYLVANPSTRHINAAVLAWMALRTSFPCPAEAKR